MGDVMRIRRKKDIMRVKKITAMLLAGVLMASTLTGCGVNKDATVATMKEQNVKSGNLIGVHHERSNANRDINGCFLRMNLETRNFEQIENIKKALTDEGIHICQ